MSRAKDLEIMVRLVASHETLLEACEEMHRLLNCQDKIDVGKLDAQLCAAIAKAKAVTP